MGPETRQLQAVMRRTGAGPAPSLSPPEVTDAEIAEAFAGTNFGDAVPRDLLALSVLKKALHYHCGHTITEIMVRMRLTTPKGRVTERGRVFCYRELKLGRSG